jgi:hypothetical protein
VLGTVGVALLAGMVALMSGLPVFWPLVAVSAAVIGCFSYAAFEVLKARSAWLRWITSTGIALVIIAVMVSPLREQYRKEAQAAAAQQAAAMPPRPTSTLLVPTPEPTPSASSPVRVRQPSAVAARVHASRSPRPTTASPSPSPTVAPSAPVPSPSIVITVKPRHVRLTLTHIYSAVAGGGSDTSRDWTFWLGRASTGPLEAPPLLSLPSRKFRDEGTWKPKAPLALTLLVDPKRPPVIAIRGEPTDGGGVVVAGSLRFAPMFEKNLARWRPEAVSVWMGLAGKEAAGTFWFYFFLEDLDTIAALEIARPNQE